MKIAILTGANYSKSTSTQLSRYIQALLLKQDIEVTFIDLHVSPVPFYDPESEEVDANTHHMAKAVLDADGIILSTPEYHGAMSGVLKNALDHLGYEQFDGKPVLAVSSAGGAVGTSSLLQIQAIVRNLHGINCPEWISIGGEQRKFDENGEPANEKVKLRVSKTVQYFIGMIEKLRT